MAITRLQSSWLGYDPDTLLLLFWDGSRMRPLQEAAGYAPAVHSHPEADVSGLVSDLAAKLGLAGGNLSGGLGINGASFDSINRLALLGLASLFYNSAGSFQHKLSKNADGDTASVVFQRAFGSRAEFGLIGDNALRAKVSPDGTTWRDAFTVDPSTGIVTFLQGIAGGGRLMSQTAFTSNGTWTRGSGTRFTLSGCWGGGGAGGGAQGGTGAGACGAGGGAGGFSLKWTDVTAIASAAVTVGAGGTAGSSSGGTGGTGGTSSFGALHSADGGVGGTGQASGSFAQIVAGGYGGNASGGDFNFTGGAGAPGIRLDANNGVAGRGAAAAVLSGGGNGYAGNAAGQQGIARGDGGGGGVVTNNATGQAGGAGSTGLVWVWEYQ